MKAVSGREFGRALKKHGWTLERMRGAHQVWSKEGFPSVTIPVHAGTTLKTGLQTALMKQTGLKESDL